MASFGPQSIYFTIAQQAEGPAGTVMSQSRRLAAILAADIAGYSALMGSDEARTVSDLKGHQAVVLPMVNEFGGRVIDTAGDGILAEFPSVLNAVECAVAIQRKMVERNTAIEPELRMELRIGSKLGDVNGPSPHGNGVEALPRQHRDLHFSRRGVTLIASCMPKACQSPFPGIYRHNFSECDS